MNQLHKISHKIISDYTLPLQTEIHSMVTIRKAEPNDAQTILDFILEIAEYEQLAHEVENSVEKIHSTFFCDHRKVFCLMVENEGEAIGYAIYFYTYSTFVGKHGLYLEDFYVKEEFRRMGIGKLIFNHLIQITNDEDLGRMEWMVLNWNEPAINFYKKYNATSMDEWSFMRLTENQLRNI